MKNKKGFTLIELLAVIVILAIIALIATPIILNMINDARKSAAVDSAYGYIEAIDYNNAMAQLNNKYNKIASGDVTTINNDVKVKGTKPTSGTIDIDVSGRVIEADLCIDGFNIVYQNEKAKATDSTKCDNNINKEPIVYKVYNKGDEIYLDPTGSVTNCTKELAESNLNANGTSTGITSGCMKFYVITTDDDNSKKSINVILDHNTSGNVAWNSAGNNLEMVEVAARLKEDTIGWIGNPRLITADEIAEITCAKGALQWSSDKEGSLSYAMIGTNVSTYYLDGSKGTDTTWQTKIAKSQGASEYAWLYDNTRRCTNNGCNVQDNAYYPCETKDSSTTNSINGYWTSTKMEGDPNTRMAWVVLYSGSITADYVNSYISYGVRPVITIDKSILS